MGAREVEVEELPLGLSVLGACQFDGAEDLFCFGQTAIRFDQVPGVLTTRDDGFGATHQQLNQADARQGSLGVIHDRLASAAEKVVPFEVPLHTPGVRDEEDPFLYQQIAIVQPLQDARAAARAGVEFHQFSGVGNQNCRACDQGLCNHRTQGLGGSRRKRPGKPPGGAHSQASCGSFKGRHPTPPKDYPPVADPHQMIEHTLAPEGVDPQAQDGVGDLPFRLSALQVQADQIGTVEGSRKQQAFAQDRRYIAPDRTHAASLLPAARGHFHLVIGGYPEWCTAEKVQGREDSQLGLYIQAAIRMHHWWRDEFLESAAEHVQLALSCDQWRFPNQMPIFKVVAGHVEFNATTGPDALHDHMGTHHQGRAGDSEAFCIAARISIPVSVRKVIPNALAGLQIKSCQPSLGQHLDDLKIVVVMFRFHFEGQLEGTDHGGLAGGGGDDAFAVVHRLTEAPVGIAVRFDLIPSGQLFHQRVAAAAPLEVAGFRMQAEQFATGADQETVFNANGEEPQASFAAGMEWIFGQGQSVGPAFGFIAKGAAHEGLSVYGREPALGRYGRVGIPAAQPAVEGCPDGILPCPLPGLGWQVS